ncbi:MAG: hypothetical protein QXR68_07265 [Pyrobaculum sp.]
MRFQIYVRESWKEVLDKVIQIGVPYTLEIRNIDTNRSPITTALEYSHLEPDALIFQKVDLDNVEWYILFADQLNVRRVVLPPPPSLEDIAKIYDTSVQYGIEINWIYGRPPMSRIVDVETAARVVKPTAARIVYDPVYVKGMKELYSDIVALGGFIREIFLSNRRGQRGPRLPPFNPLGVINYVEVLHALYLLQWEGRLTIRQSPAYITELDLQLRLGAEVLETAKGAGVSKKVQKRISKILEELMSQ